MINLAVINIKDIIKFLRNCIIIIIMFFTILKFVDIIQNLKDFSFPSLKEKIGSNHTEVINRTIVLSSYFNKNFLEEKSGLKKILVSELAIFSDEEKLMEKENQEEITEFNKNENNNVLQENLVNENTITEIKSDVKEEIVTNLEIQEIPSHLKTNIISKNNKTDTYTNVYHSVKIKNESGYTLTEDMMMPNIDFINKKDIIIYHTHTCESYTPTTENNYVASGNFRTTDLNYSVVRVGSELTNNLKTFGFNVVHNASYHDYPAYTGSYTRALSTIKGILASNPNSQFVIDLHRDALGSNSSYAPSVQIGDEIAAQLMFVMGSDGGGLDHHNWLNNFKLAVKIQEKANEMYPGLFKPIMLRNSRYNQHVTTGACIIEVGATGNTIEQCNISMKYFAKVLEEVMK